MATQDAGEINLIDDRTGQVVACVAVFCTLSTTAVLMRLWSKTMKSGIKIDDYFLIASQVCVLAWCTMLASSTRWAGLGHRAAALSPQQIVNFAKMIFLSAFILPTALMLSKISMLLLLHHLFPGSQFRWTVRVLAVIVIAWWLTHLVGEIFICTPIHSHWDTTVTAHCGNQQAFLIGMPIPWIVTDFAILLAPIPVLKQLQLPKVQKLGLIALFLVGAITCVISVIRFTTLFYSTEDVSYDIVPAALWSVVEANTTSFCAAIIACRPVLSLLYPTKFIDSMSDRFYSRSSHSRSSRKISKDKSSIKVVSEVAVERVMP